MNVKTPYLSSDHFVDVCRESLIQLGFKDFGNGSDEKRIFKVWFCLAERFFLWSSKMLSRELGRRSAYNRVISSKEKFISHVSWDMTILWLTPLNHEWTHQRQRILVSKSRIISLSFRNEIHQMNYAELRICPTLLRRVFKACLELLHSCHLLRLSYSKTFIGLGAYDIWCTGFIFETTYWRAMGFIQR